MISNGIKYVVVIIALTVLSGCIKTARNESLVYNNLHITNDTVWEGNILIEGICTVEAGAVLKIRPGTLIDFVWKDENMDGIGESSIYVFGTLLAEGEKNMPIVFSSDSRTGKMRRYVSNSKFLWEGLYFIASEGDPNVLQYCKFKNANRALHSHFSKVEMTNTIVFNNGFGFQFQESEIEIKDSIFNGNYTALRFRNSKAVVTNSVFFDNYSAVHSFRSDIIFEKNVIKDNCLEGLRFKESTGNISNSLIVKNRYGILVQEGELTIDDNSVSKNELDGIAGNNSKLNIGRNYILDNGLNGISLNNSEAVLNNNNITGNRKFNLDNKGPLKIEAANNFWGHLNAEEIAKTIEDGEDDAISGFVIFKPFLNESAVDIKLFKYGKENK